MTIDTAVVNGKIVTPTSIIEAGIGIDNGKIVAVCKEPLLPQASKTIDAKGKFIIPGLIDPHLHIGNENYGNITDPKNLAQYESDCKTETQAAAAGGVTVLGNYVLEPKNGIQNMFGKYKEVFERQAIADCFFHAFIVSKKLKTEIEKLPEVGITSFKLLIGYKGPQAQLLGIEPLDDGDVYEVFETIAGMPSYPGKNVMVHAEDADIFMMRRPKLMAQGRTDLKAWHDSRPNFVEEEIIRRTIFFSKVTGCPLYIVHNTIGEAVDRIAEAKAQGIPVVGETCVQYLTLNNDDPYLNKYPPLGNVNPPVRSKWDNEKLWEGIRRGVMECIGSDHATYMLKTKGVGVAGKTIWDAPMGLGNLTEMILPVILSEGVNKNKITIQKVVEVCCQNTARVFGLYPKKGTISVGSDADIVIVDINKKQKVSPKTHHSYQDWNSWDGWELKGWPIFTMLRGQIVFEDSKIVGKPGIGKYLARKS